MPQNYSLGGNLVRKEEYEKVRGIIQPTAEKAVSKENKDKGETPKVTEKPKGFFKTKTKTKGK